MPKEVSKESDLETEFIATAENLRNQMCITYADRIGDGNPIYLTIASITTETRHQELQMHANGSWSAREGQNGWPLRFRQSILEEYAEITDPNFYAINREKRGKYLEDHKDVLLTGLIKAMETQLNALQNSSVE